MKPEIKIRQAKKTLLISLLTVPLLVFLLGKVLPDLPSSNILRDHFWANKIANENQYDIVLIGDSRIYRGVNPHILSQKMNATVFNYGFSSAGLDSLLLNHALQLLKPNGRKILLIGITPASFTNASLKNAHFKSLKGTANKDIWIRKYVYPKLTFFNNYSFSDLKKVSMNENYFQTFYTNGFVYSDKTPADTFNALPAYIDFLHENKVNVEAKKEFLQLISRLHSEGFTCYGFRVPVSKPIETLENGIFDFQRFQDDFKKANGNWINISQSGFKSYDGSHLDGLAANKLSVILADSLNANYH